MVKISHSQSNPEKIESLVKISKNIKMKTAEN